MKDKTSNKTNSIPSGMTLSSSVEMQVFHGLWLQ